MSKVEEYRDRAVESVELSKRVDSPADRTRLLMLAEGWLELSDKAAKIARAARDRLRRQKAESDRAEPR